MKTRCPCCGASASLEVLITHDEARSLFGGAGVRFGRSGSGEGNTGFEDLFRNAGGAQGGFGDLFGNLFGGGSSGSRRSSSRAVSLRAGTDTATPGRLRPLWLDT